MRHIFGLEVLLILLLFCVLLTGCKSAGISQQPDKTKIDKEEGIRSETELENLQFRITWKVYSGRGQAIQKIVDSYNEKNRISYKVVLVDGDEDRSSTRSSIADEGGADIFALPYRFVKAFGEERLLTEETEEFESSKSVFYPTLWALGTVSDQVYGVPWLGHSMGLIYNKDLLTQAGIDPDTIHDRADLLEACRMVELHTDAHGIGLVGAEHNDLSWMVNQFVYAFGGSLVDETGTKVTVNSKEAADAIRYYVNGLGSYAQDSWKNDTGVEVMDSFREQKVAFEIQGLWGVTDIWKCGNPFKVGVIPLDRIGIPPEIGPIMLAIPQRLGSSKKEAALDFIDYLISIEAQEMIMEGEYSPEHDSYYPFRLPVRNDIGNHLIFRGQPELAAFLSGFKNPSIDVPIPQWQYIKEEIYTPGLHRVLLNQLSIEDFLSQVEEQGNLMIKEK